MRNLHVKPSGAAAAAACAAFIALASAPAASMPPVQDVGASPADATGEDVRTLAVESYIVRRGLRARTEAAAAARRQLSALPPGLRAVAPIVGTAVAGNVEIPIVAVTFSDTSGSPYLVADLQRQLFDGPWPTGTMTEHYAEMSGGRLAVTGQAFDWRRLPQPETFYSGPIGCNGICQNARLGEMLNAALAQVDATVDFSRFDNDGPDNRPNSGDDDGFVDFVAFVHPDRGGECSRRGTSDDIWSHRFSIAAWSGSSFQTNDAGQHGTRMLVDDYVIMPALACDGTTMIQIGVFSHEFGHAFGLPDLYDTKNPPRSAGTGGWDLMASGSWGGDGSSPMAPSHMSAWSKEFLGWLSPRVVEGDEEGVRLRPVIASGDVVRIDYSEAADPEDVRYLLLEYRALEGFDRSLRSAGLLVTEVNNSRVRSGLVNNSVNATQFDMGVNVVEADGLRHLDRNQNRADRGDVFPGQGGVANVDSTHAEGIRAALCNIRQEADAVTLDVLTSRTSCPGTLPEQVAISPAQARGGDVVRGAEVVVRGILSNEGTNYFTDRRLVLKGGGDQGGEIPVTAPVPLSTARDRAAPAEGNARADLGSVLGKEVILRGRVRKEPQKGVGLADVLVVEEMQVVE